MLVLTTFHTFLPRHSWHKLLYLSCKDWLRNTTATTEHTITGYSTEIIGAFALISINKIIVLYTDSSILARVWFAFAFFYILHRWHSRLRRFFNATARYLSTSAVIFWEKPKDGAKQIMSGIGMQHIGSFFIRDCSETCLEKTILWPIHGLHSSWSDLYSFRLKSVGHSYRRRVILFDWWLQSLVLKMFIVYLDDT